MRRYMSLLLFFAVPFFATPQGGFVKNYDLGQLGLVFTNMLLHGDTLVVTGIAVTPPPDPVQAIVFAKMDTMGNLLSQKTYVDSAGGNYTPGEYPRGFLKASDGTGYVLLGHVFERKNGLAMKINGKGDVLWLREYEDEGSRQDHYRSVLELETGFLIVGSKQALDYSNDLFVMKIDKNGNKVWEELYGGDNGRRDYFGDMVVVGPNEYVIGSSTGDDQGVPWQQQSHTVKLSAIDSLGNELWSWESGPSLEELWLKGLHRTAQGHWAYTTAQGMFEPDGYQKRRARFVIRDGDTFAVLEDRFLDGPDIGSTNHLLDLVPLSGGGWLGVGGNFEWVADPFFAEAHVYA